MVKFLNDEIVESADEWPCNVISVQHEIEGDENCGVQLNSIAQRKIRSFCSTGFLAIQQPSSGMSGRYETRTLHRVGNL
jgi:hypothetical protein